MAHKTTVSVFDPGGVPAVRPAVPEGAESIDRYVLTLYGLLKAPLLRRAK